MKIYIKELLTNKKLIVVFLVALVIRVWGLNYGFPHILNVDEPSFVRSVTGLRFSLNPNRFDWPNGLFYLHFVFYTLFYYFRVLVQFVGLKNTLQNVLPLLWQDPIVFYFISRLINAFLGALTVFPLYYSSKKLLKNSTLALFSAITLAFIPYHVYDSHLALLDTALAFWCSVSLYFIFSLIKTPSYKNFALSGLFLGIAFGTKYNAIFYWIIVVIAYYYSVLNFKYFLKLSNILGALKKFILSIFFFIFGFVLTNPYVLFNFKLFWSNKYGRGFLFQFENVGSNNLTELPSEFIKLFYTQTLNDLGLGIYFVFIIGVLLYCFFCYRNKITNLTLLLPLSLLVYMVTKQRNPSHYFVFLYPLISIFFVYFIYKTVNFLNTFKKINIKSKYLFYILFALLISFSVKDSIYTSFVFSNKDTRVLAFNYLKNNLSKQDLVYYYGNDLDLISFVDINEKKIRRIDVSNVDESKLPFYLLIGEYGLNYSDVMEGKRDTSKLKGNESKFLKNSDLLFYTVPVNQKGPSIYLFKINEINKN